MSETPQDGIVTPVKTTNTERARRAVEASTLFPSTSEGDKAAIQVMELMNNLHQAPLRGVEDVFTEVRTIFQAFNISLDI